MDMPGMAMPGGAMPGMPGMDMGIQAALEWICWNGYAGWCDAGMPGMDMGMTGGMPGMDMPGMAMPGGAMLWNAGHGYGNDGGMLESMPGGAIWNAGHGYTGGMPGMDMEWLCRVKRCLECRAWIWE